MEACMIILFIPILVFYFARLFIYCWELNKLLIVIKLIYIFHNTRDIEIMNTFLLWPV